MDFSLVDRLLNLTLNQTLDLLARLEYHKSAKHSIKSISRPHDLERLLVKIQDQLLEFSARFEFIKPVLKGAESKPSSPLEVENIQLRRQLSDLRRQIRHPDIVCTGSSSNRRKITATVVCDGSDDDDLDEPDHGGDEYTSMAQ